MSDNSNNSKQQEEEEDISTDEEVSDDLIVDLIFKSATGSTQSHRLQNGINVIGRGKPVFISDAKISRRHAEIIVSSSVTYNQLGQNHSILLRPESEAIKLTKGVSQTIKNNDSIALYEGAEPFSIRVEKIGGFTPMSFDDFSNDATQQLHDDVVHQSPLDYLHKRQPSAAVTAGGQNTTPKRTRDSMLQPSTKIISNNNDIAVEQIEKKLKKSPDSLNSSAVLIQDSLKLSINEEEFTFVRKIGQGACGEVCQYEWKGTPVAVKVIYKSLLHKDTKGEFEKETEILKCLRHPNVVLFMGTCTLKGNLSIITEYLNRGSLRDVLNSPLAAELDWNTKIKMSSDIAQGMNYLHTYNPKIIHRDLKTLNLLVDTNFNVKVSDFGLSRFVSSSNEIAKTFCGTLPWIAPEVFAGNGYTTQADVFSFGIVLWEILTHKQPQGNTATTPLGHPEIPPSCPLPFAELIRECCSRKPEQRPTFQQIIQKLKSMTTLVPSFPQTHLSTSNAPSNAQQSYNTVPGQPSTQPVDLSKWTIALSSIANVKLVSKEPDGTTILKGVYNGKPVSIKNFTTPITEAEQKQWAVLASVKSVHAVEFYGVVYNKQEHAIISEYMANGSLEALMLNTAFNLTLETTLNLALQMSESIHVLHTHTPVILHRGITSSSFLLDDQYNLKITDFGLSRFQIHENMISLAEIKGNYIYSPPELLSQGQFTPKSDVYSFAIVLWELFERFSTKVYKKPFSDIELDYDFQILNHTGKLNKRPTINEKTPKEISKLLQQCWDSEPRVRPSFDQIKTELKNIKRKLITMNQQ
ncbi:hypothetical protein CYY_003579 [Polysphondylium violaceum]|uniref:Protein kinase domain-containing protein n=1 Tax=Polysphondylium violaceum TaxID=133409 RepID=A0A8J4PYY0_9MYCE|nr:hypothetical protein CYY_003579 [Polysphondylium violaceum]